MVESLSGAQLSAEVERYRALAREYSNRAEGAKDRCAWEACKTVAESYVILADATERLLDLIGKELMPGAR
jgi:hypothetical protein